MTNNKINKLKNIIQVYTNTENMTNNKLAVEWLAKSYVDLLTKLNNEEISLKEFEIQYIELLEQAKEMEKQQRSIELPSDEEIDEKAFQVPYDNTKDFYDLQFIKGAKWMRDKIKGDEQ